MAPREAARLMGLPEVDALPESAIEAVDLVGDGVCIPVVRWLAENILEPIHEAAYKRRRCGRGMISSGLSLRRRIACISASTAGRRTASTSAATTRRASIGRVGRAERLVRRLQSRPDRTREDEAEAKRITVDDSPHCESVKEKQSMFLHTQEGGLINAAHASSRCALLGPRTIVCV
jgi:hypothetical protein